MKRNLMYAAGKVSLGLYLTLTISVAAAQAPGSVVESQGFTPGQSQPAVSNSSSNSASPSASNSDALSLLLDQNRQLQSEVQALRALVEEQNFEIRKMQRDSLNRYTNVDDRLSSLESGLSTAAVSTGTPLDNSQGTSGTTLGNNGRSPTAGGNTDPANSGIAANPSSTNGSTNGSINSSANAGNTTRNVGRGTLQPAVLSEQQLYQMAYESVINSNFERSIAEFDQYLSIYSSGRFATNAHYWKGQAFLGLRRYEESRDSYEIILNDYPESAKLPDAMYGLSSAYLGLGNTAQARQLLNEIKTRFPSTGVANLADTRLLSLEN